MLSRLLAPHAEKAYFLLRFLSGLAFSQHGFQKIFHVLVDPNHPPPAFGELGWWAGLIELVAGLCIAFGLATRWAAFLASGEMAVAYIGFHWKGRFDENFFPLKNAGEPAFIYCFLFLFIACKGAGVCSLDRLVAKGRASNPMP